MAVVVTTGGVEGKEEEEDLFFPLSEPKIVDV